MILHENNHIHETTKVSRELYFIISVSIRTGIESGRLMVDMKVSLMAQNTMLL